MNIPDFHIWAVPEWIISSIGVFALACTAHYVLGQLTNKLDTNSDKKHILWKNALLKGLKKPVFLLIWIICIEWILNITKNIVGNPVLTDLSNFNVLTGTGILTWTFFRFTKEAETRLLTPDKDGTKSDPTTVIAVGRLLRVTASIMALLVIIQLLGINISGMLAFGGAGGLIVGYAAKDILANFFGGLVIYLDKPFGVGDWVRSPDQEIEGFVEYIGWRHTRIRTFNKRPLYVPNASFTKISVENPSRMENRRIKETIGLRYEDSNKIEDILLEVRSYLRNNDKISKEKITMVNFNSFGPSSLDFFIYCFTKTIDWATYHMVKEKVLIDVLNIIHKHNADIAFPTQTLDLPSFTPQTVLSNTSKQKKQLVAP